MQGGGATEEQRLAMRRLRGRKGVERGGVTPTGEQGRLAGRESAGGHIKRAKIRARESRDAGRANGGGSSGE